jgi:rhodanese-related sulfurtransferase
MKTLSILVSGLLLVSAGFADNTKVKITKNTSSVMVSHLGQKVEIKRIQDPYHILSDDYTKTSRECPPFCIHPMKVADGVQTIGEVEMMDFIKNYINKDRGVIVDARLPSWYKVETIPSAINIPFTLLEEADKETVDTIFSSLGAKKSGNSWDFSDAKTLIVFDNGVWCDQATRFVKSILKAGYATDKIKYYRDGFQGWKLLGLTTVIMEKKEVK